MIIQWRIKSRDAREGQHGFVRTGTKSREILRKCEGKETTHFNADASNTELLFRFIHSVNQLSICGVLSNWCEKFRLTEEEQGHEKQKESVTKGFFDKCTITRSKTFVSSPRTVSGNSLWENIQEFESVSETNRFTRVCDLASFQHRVLAGMTCKTRPDGDNGYGQIIPYTLSRVNSIQSLCSNSRRNNCGTNH